MGNLSKYAGIAAWIALIIPVAFGKFAELFYVAMLLGIVAILLGFMGKGEADQSSSAKIGMLTGGFALAINFLTTLLY